MADVPEFIATPLDEIPEIVSKVRKTFLTNKTKSIEYRLTQLRKLYWGLKDNEAAITEALKRDLRKPSFETVLAEYGWCENDIVFVQKNLEKWAKDEAAPDIPFMFKMMGPRIRKEPMGTVLVIGAFNYPIQLSLGPMIGAIAAGCTVILKPSENAPNAAAIMQKIISESLDPEAFAVVQGAVPETSLLLDQKWDKIFYTGGETVGKIIAKKAAETLTPVVLELGGRNPAIITRNADPRIAARRLLWAKVHNAGQVCVSQNYILVDKQIMPAFIAEIKKALTEFYPEGTRNSPNYARIATPRSFQRIKKMLDTSRGKILAGGTMDEADLFLEPTVVQVEGLNDPLIVDESFGPLIPILAVDDLDHAIRIANEVHDTPLGIYPFGNKQETAKVLDSTRSGGASINDGFFHASIQTLAFGGVGTSGQGSYRGRASFDAFTHRRSVTTTPAWLEGVLDMRYPPYTPAKVKKYVSSSMLKPDFDREGKVVRGWLRLLFGLGADGAVGGAFRWAVIALVAAGMRQYLQRRSKL